jgi:dihydropteroate synthase
MSIRIGGRDFLDADGPYVVGVINLSPESPIREAVVPDTAGALERARQLVAGGASMIDLGGRSSLHSARYVSPEEERARLLPAVEALKREGFLISVDTWDAETARVSLEAGADLINDSGGFQDPRMIEVIARAACPVVVPFLNGPTPRDLTPLPADPVAAVLAFFAAAVERARRAGVTQLLLDPGTGYAQPHATWEEKEVYQDSIYPHLPRLRVYGCPIYVAPPWKPPEEQLGNFTRVLRESGADFLRAHNIAIAARAVEIVRAERAERTGRHATAPTASQALAPERPA